MDYEIYPQIGYGPIKFDMSPKEVQGILGKPCRSQLAISERETDEEEIKFLKNRRYDWYGENYTDGKLPQITYDEDNAKLITIFKQSGPLIYKGMDLHKKKKRQDILEALAKDEEVYYYNEENFFFPKAGLIVPIPKYTKGLFYIVIAETSHMIPRLEFEMYEQSTALD